MESWITQAVSSEHLSVAALVAVFLMGMVSVVTCGCNFAVLGIVAGYTGASAAGSRPKFAVLRGVAFLVGGIISMALIGALFGYAGKWVSNSLGTYWKIAAGLLAILFGLYTMDFLPFRLPGFSIDPKYAQGNILSAALFGLAVGGLTTALNTCCNPVFPVILAASFLKGSVI